MDWFRGGIGGISKVVGEWEGKEEGRVKSGQPMFHVHQIYNLDKWHSYSDIHVHACTCTCTCMYIYMYM